MENAYGFVCHQGLFKWGRVSDRLVYWGHIITSQDLRNIEDIICAFPSSPPGTGVLWLPGWRWSSQAGRSIWNTQRGLLTWQMVLRLRDKGQCQSHVPNLMMSRNEEVCLPEEQPRRKKIKLCRTNNVSSKTAESTAEYLLQTLWAAVQSLFQTKLRAVVHFPYIILIISALPISASSSTFFWTLQLADLLLVDRTNGLSSVLSYGRRAICVTAAWYAPVWLPSPSCEFTSIFALEKPNPWQTLPTRQDRSMLM